MERREEQKDKNDYIVLFKGAKLSKRQANIVGLCIFFGLIGIFVSFLFTGWKNKSIGYGIIIIFVIIGDLVGYKIFKK